MPVLGGSTTSPSSPSSGQQGIYNLRDYGAKCDVVTKVTGTIATGSSTLTDTTASFTSALVGKTLWVNGVMGTIVAVPSPTTLTMSFNSTYSNSNTPYAYGTDDTAAVAATLAAVPENGGTIMVPGLTFDSATHSYTNKRGLQFVGVGGRVGPTPTKGAGLSGGGRAFPASGLIYTGSGAGCYQRFVDCLDITFREMAVLYAQVSYTGDLIQFLGTNGVTPGMFFDIERCLLAPIVDSPNFQANCLINLSGAVFVTMSANAYGNAKYHVIGLDPDALSKGATNQFSNAVSFFSGEFTDAKIASILNPGESWQFSDLTFEPIQGPKAGAVICSPHTKNLTISGCGFWDAIAAGGTWLKVQGEAIRIRDCFIQDAGNNDIYIDASAGHTVGLVVEGNQFAGYSNPTGQTVLKPPANGSGFTITGLWFKANTFKQGATDPTAALQAATSVTFAT